MRGSKANKKVLRHHKYTMSRLPKLTAWRSQDELIELRSLFFPESNSVSLKQRAIQIVQSFETKCKIPHTIQSTSQLTSISIQFNTAYDDEQSIQLSATMCLIRFVNGLLDPSQQSQFAIPLNVLAKKIGLPSWFVEIRHAGTHEALPSLEMLELCIENALKWLFENYWVNITEIEGEDIIEEKVDVKELQSLFKKYRKVRRNDVNKIFKIGDSTDQGKEFWTSVKEICSKIGEVGFNDVVIQLITNGRLKWEQSKLFYVQLFNYMLLDYFDEFLFTLVDDLIKKLYEYEKFKGLELKSGMLQNDDEVKIAKNWTRWLTLENIDKYKDGQFDQIVNIIGKINMSFTVGLLEELKDKARSVSKIEEKLNFLKGLNTKRDNDIKDVFEDLENLKKRIKLDNDVKKPVKLFVRYDNWTPKPFGEL